MKYFGNLSPYEFSQLRRPPDTASPTTVQNQIANALETVVHNRTALAVRSTIQHGAVISEALGSFASITFAASLDILTFMQPGSNFESRVMACFAKLSLLSCKQNELSVCDSTWTRLADGIRSEQKSYLLGYAKNRCTKPIN